MFIFTRGSQEDTSSTIVITLHHHHLSIGEVKRFCKNIARLTIETNFTYVLKTKCKLISVVRTVITMKSEKL